VALTAAVDYTTTPFRLTVTSNSRIHAAKPAVTQDYRITVAQLDATGAVADQFVVSGTRVITPAVPAYTDPITVTDDSGRIWTKQTDDGTTAVYTG